MWVYIRSEPGLHTVGYHAPDGTWHTDSDHQRQEDAAERARYLNGGVPAVVCACPYCGHDITITLSRVD